VDLGLEHDRFHWTHLCLTRCKGELGPRYYAFVPEINIRVLKSNKVKPL